jgi:hypothetical protein
MGKLSNLPDFFGGWELIEDMGMYEISSINNVSGNLQRKHYIKIKCPDCGGVIERELGNLKSRLNKGGRLICPLCPGAANKRLHSAYACMVARCYDPKRKSYPGHGGKGVKVCEEWLDNKKAFYKWALENGWKPGLYLDREDNDGDYTPGNCRWVTPSISAYNRGLFKNNTSGVKGISPYKNPRSSKHRWQVRDQGKRVGYYDTFEEAVEALNKAKNINP